jgi:aryl-alcohol dehydrogenase-like predicted oxidoreductase
LCGGWLTGKYGRGRPYPAGSRMTQRPEPYAELASEATFAKLDMLGQFARQRGVAMAAVALAWLLSDERIAQIVIGPGRPEHLQPVADAIEHPLTVAERAGLAGAFG